MNDKRFVGATLCGRPFRPAPNGIQSNFPSRSVGGQKFSRIPSETECAERGLPPLCHCGLDPQSPEKPLNTNVINY
jgi:hypothetical protein